MTARQLAVKVLYEIDKNGAYTGIELKKQLSSCELSSVDKAFATELIYGVIKNRTRIDYIISKYSKQKLKKISDWILNILRIGVYQMIFLDKVPQSAAVNESVKLAKRYGHAASSGFVNGILRSISRNGDVSYPDGNEYYEIFHSHPKWLVDMLFSQYGEDAKKIIENNNSAPNTTIRVNILKTTPQDLLDSLESKNITVTKTSEDNILIISGYGDISSLDEYKNGLFTPQGMGSYIAVKNLEPKENEVVLDLCSAPGGKTTAIAEICGDKAEIYAFDIYEHKKILIENNCKRLGISSVKADVADATEIMQDFVGKADKVLADVPCSGLGIIRKKPDIKWNKESTDFDEIIRIQNRILNNAAKYLKKGGTLVYSTCTLNKAENEDVVNGFSSQNGFEIEFMKTFMPSGEYDGFYVCKMIKE